MTVPADVDVYSYGVYKLENETAQFYATVNPVIMSGKGFGKQEEEWAGGTGTLAFKRLTHCCIPATKRVGWESRDPGFQRVGPLLHPRNQESRLGEPGPWLSKG